MQHHTTHCTSLHCRAFLLAVLPFCATYFPLSETHIDLCPLSISSSKLSFYLRTVHHNMTGSEMLNVTSFPAPPPTFVLENWSSCLYQAEAPFNDLKGKLGWHIFRGSVWFPLTHTHSCVSTADFFFFFFAGNLIYISETLIKHSSEMTVFRLSDVVWRKGNFKKRGGGCSEFWQVYFHGNKCARCHHTVNDVSGLSFLH